MTGVTERHPLLRTSPIKVMNANSRLHQATGTPMLEKLEQIIIIRQGCPVHARVSDDRLPPLATPCPPRYSLGRNEQPDDLAPCLPVCECPVHPALSQLGLGSVCLRRRTHGRVPVLVQGQHTFWSYCIPFSV